MCDRDYLKDIEIVGAVLIYREGEQCRWSLDWLYANCDRVCILLDNYNEETKNVVLEYKNKYPDRTYITESEVPVVKTDNPGYIKRRFKLNQDKIRETMFEALRKVNTEKKIDILIWPDSDETFIDEFPKYLTSFWEKDNEWMMLGFLEVFDSMQILMRQRMVPHGRVYKYKKNMTVFPWQGRTMYMPNRLTRPLKIRYVIVHVCHLTEEYRKKRQSFDNTNFLGICERDLWILPKDVRKMTVEEIMEYQPSHRGAPSKYPSITMDEYINNKHKYKVKKWIKD